MRRYEDGSAIINDGFGRRKATMYYPDIPPKTSDEYIISKHVTRCDLLANDKYGDPQMWVVIHSANKLPGGTLRIPPGRRIRIPDITKDEYRQLLIENQF